MSDMEATGNLADPAAETSEPDGNRVEADSGSTARGGLAAGVVEYVVKALVDEPEEVQVELDDSHRRGVELRVHVAGGDMGRVIGRRGRTAQAIRSVARAAGARDGVDIQVDIEE